MPAGIPCVLMKESIPTCVQLIHFYFTYILEELHPGLSGRVCLMPPGTTFLLLNSGKLTPVARGTII